VICNGRENSDTPDTGHRTVNSSSLPVKWREKEAIFGFGFSCFFLENKTKEAIVVVVGGLSTSKSKFVYLWVTWRVYGQHVQTREPA